MKNYVEHNFVAGGDIKEGQALSYDATTHGLVPAVKDDLIVGVAGQTVDAGMAVNIHTLEPGKVINVLVSATVTEGAKLGVNADGGIVTFNDSTTGVLPLQTVEAKTISTSDFVRCVVVF